MALVSLAGCSSGAASNQVLSPVSLGMTNSIPTYYDDGNLTLYETQMPVELPIARPTSAQIQALGPAPKGTPYPRMPFLTADDEIVTIHYVLTNLDSTEHDCWILIDPWNEFVRYRPGVTVVDDDVTVPNLGYDLAFPLQANSRLEGDITSDDTKEIAIKLASTENLLESPQTQASLMIMDDASAEMDNSLSATQVANHFFDPQNRSNDGDPLFAEWIPPVIAGLTGFDLGLRTNAPANIAVQLTIQIQDTTGNHVVEQGSTTLEMGVPPVVLSPPSARFQ